MPTFKITNRHTGAVLVPSVQADSDISAGLEYVSSFSLPSGPSGGSPRLEWADIIVSQTSPNPPAVVYTIVVPLDPTHQQGGIKEVLTTGSRQTALNESAKNPAFSVVEETREQNQQRAKERKG